MLEDEFELIGEELCLDFTNTIGGWRGGEMTEKLNSYTDLLRWGVKAGSISQDYAERLLDAAEKQPAKAASALTHAHKLRESLFRIIMAATRQTSASAKDLALFNNELNRAMIHAQLVQHDDHFHWTWREDNQDLSAVLWAVMRSAANLLTDSERLQWVHQCSNDECDWLFLDTTKNHSRRWCDMKTCGNIHKVRKHRQRQQSQN